jgi:hypothetical protein
MFENEMAFNSYESCIDKLKSQLAAKDREIFIQKERNANDEKMYLAELAEARQEVERLKMEGDSDYKDMRTFQAKFIAADHEISRLKAELEKCKLRWLDGPIPDGYQLINFKIPIKFIILLSTADGRLLHLGPIDSTILEGL